MKIQDFAPHYEQTSTALPTYQRIKDMILQLVSQGNLVPGSQIPSENELVDALGISRMTVNRAMRELTSEGILTRSRGVGTFIASPKAPGSLFEVHNIADEIKERGHVHSTRVIALEELFTEDDAGWGPGQIPAELGDHAFHSVILHYENEEPFQLEERFVSPELAPDYLAQDFSTSTPNDYLTRVAPLSRGKHVVEAVLASDPQSELLCIDPSQPCLRIERYTYSDAGLVSAARLLHPGSRIRLEGEFGN